MDQCVAQPQFLSLVAADLPHVALTASRYLIPALRLRQAVVLIKHLGGEARASVDGMGLEDHIRGLRAGLPQNFTNSTKKKGTPEDTFDSRTVDVVFRRERGNRLVFFFFFSSWGEAPDVRLGNAAEVFKATTWLRLQDASAFSRFLSGCCHHIS